MFLAILLHALLETVVRWQYKPARTKKKAGRIRLYNVGKTLFKEVHLCARC